MSDRLYGRLAREYKTVEAMIRLYCQAHHHESSTQSAESRKALCPDCTALLAYCEQRLAACPFAAQKPTCFNCTIHCYRPEMKERIREVMRTSGPAMLFRHPILALRHLIHGWLDPQRGSSK